MTAAELADRIRAKSRGQWYDACCPVHEDTRPSLSFREGDQGGIIFKCHRGCVPKDVASAMAEAVGVHPSAFSRERAKAQPNHRQAVATYDYTDEAGALLYQEVRTEPKDFFLRRPDGQRGWISNLKGIRKVIYRLPEIGRAMKALAPEQRIVVIVEGCKDADTLNKHGLLATTNPMGAGKWRTEYTDQLVQAGVKVVAILRDNDKPGEAHAAQVATSCLRSGLQVKHLNLPGLPPIRDKHGEDVTDWLATGHSIEDLRELIQAAKYMTESELQKPVVPRDARPVRSTCLDASCASSFPLTDLGNSERLVAQFGNDIRWLPQWGWRVWDGRRWERDEGACRLMQIATKAVRALYIEASKIENPEERKRLVSHATASEARARLEAVVKLAEHQVVAGPSDFDRDPMLLNVQNGVIDLRSGILRPHRREDLLTKITPVSYDPDASASKWDQFLTDITDSNQTLTGFLQKAVGYSLTGRTDEQVLFMLYGVGANGKTTLLKLIGEALGDYAMQTPSETLLAKREGSIPNDVARLIGARLVTAVEADDGRRLAEALVKQMTGNDKVAARFLHREFFEFTPGFKIFLSVNHKPQIRGTDHAIWRRIRLIPFNVIFQQPDKAMPEKLRGELPGILAWAVQGCLRWQSEGLGLPDEVRAATDGYRQEEDALAQFIQERCIAVPNARVQSSDLYREYSTWCEQVGEHRLRQKEFVARLKEKGFDRVKSSGVMVWTGLGLVSPAREAGKERERLLGSFEDTASQGTKPAGILPDLPSLPNALDATAEVEVEF